MQPRDLVDRVAVRLFDDRRVDGCLALARVKVRDQAVVRAAHEEVRVLIEEVSESMSESVNTYVQTAHEVGAGPN